MASREIQRGAVASGGSTPRRRPATVAGVAVAVVAVLSGCSLFSGSAHPVSTSAHTHHSTPTASPTPSALAAGVGSGRATGSLTPPPVPSAPPAPSPTLTPVPTGTVVAEGDVASPKGSIHYHYRVVSNGDNTYSAEYSNFTSTVPVPVSVTLLDTPPRVGDGLTYHGVGDHTLGGPTTGTAPTSTQSLGDVGEPSYLGTLVTYSSVASATGVPVELGPNKVLAVDSVHWSVPVRQSNVHPADGGARPYANGTVTATTPSGAPKRYLVAASDTTGIVAERFGITIEDLLWLNPDLPGDGGNQFLYAASTLNLDPNSL